MPDVYSTEEWNTLKATLMVKAKEALAKLFYLKYKDYGIILIKKVLQEITAKVQRNSTMAHNEHCEKCKEDFLRALKKEFGEVVSQWKSGWPCRIDDVLDLPQVNKSTAQSLKKIYAALQNHRGYHNFVGVLKLPACDYYLKPLNCLIEFDESQHFSAPRALTLSLYPRNLKLGYDKKVWRKRSQELDRHDNRPVDRDEKRAWYDTLRDILPTSFGMNPTVRVFAKETVWCEDGKNTRAVINNILGRYAMSSMKQKRASKKSIHFNKVTAQHVKQAIRKMSEDGIPSNRKAKSTEILYQGKRYPAKYVLGEAYRISTKTIILTDEYTGGDAAAKVLSGIGFKILKNGKTWSPPLRGDETKIYRIFLKGNYNRKNKEHINPKFNRWVEKNGKMTPERMESIFNKLINHYAPVRNSVIVFPACTLVIINEKDKNEWDSILRGKSKDSTIIMGILDKTKSIKHKEYTAVWNNRKYSELHPYEPEEKLPIGDGWVYNSTSIDENLDTNNPGKYCLVIGHGAYKRKGMFKKISRENSISIIVTTWYKSLPSSSSIYKNGKEIKHDVRRILAEYHDIVDKLKAPFVKKLLVY